jgi:hypothetical protein
MGADLTGQGVRLGMAIIIIILVSIGLYQFSARAHAVEPAIMSMPFGR